MRATLANHCVLPRSAWLRFQNSRHPWPFSATATPRCFLTLLGQLPALLSVEPVALVLNCQPHDVPVFIAARLLKPLGNPPANGVKFFATALVLELMKDATWLAKMTNAIHHYWPGKNSRKSSIPGGFAIEPPAPSRKYALNRCEALRRVVERGPEAGQ
jgi:hypothetical protein